MRFEVLLSERLGSRLSLDLPCLSICDKYASPVQRGKCIPSERASNVVFAVVFLDVLEVGRMVDNMQAEERDRYLVCGPISLI